MSYNADHLEEEEHKVELDDLEQLGSSPDKRLFFSYISFDLPYFFVTILNLTTIVTCFSFFYGFKPPARIKCYIMLSSGVDRCGGKSLCTACEYLSAKHDYNRDT